MSERQLTARHVAPEASRRPSSEASHRRQDQRPTSSARVESHQAHAAFRISHRPGPPTGGGGPSGERPDRLPEVGEGVRGGLAGEVPIGPQDLPGGQGRAGGLHRQDRDDQREPEGEPPPRAGPVRPPAQSPIRRAIVQTRARAVTCPEEKASHAKRMFQ